MTITHPKLTITAPDGGTFDAYVSMPNTDMPAGAVIVIQEIFGVNAVMREICDELARTGYIAVCPDLFWRQEPGIQLTDKSEAEWARAFELYKGFDLGLGIIDLKATLDTVRNMDGCSGKVGTLGYCLGGRLAFLMACRSDADCSVSYYGVAIDENLAESDNIMQPLLMHVAEKDKFVPPAAQQKIIDRFKDSSLVQVNIYEGQDHAFARVGGDHYDAEAARLANTRTADFLATYLGND